MSDHAKVLREMVASEDSTSHKFTYDATNEIAALRAGANALDVLGLAEGPEAFIFTSGSSGDGLVVNSYVLGVVATDSWGETPVAARHLLTRRLLGELCT